MLYKQSHTANQYKGHEKTILQLKQIKNKYEK
jgi:hypothetical protein